VNDLRPNIWLLQAQGDSKGLIDALQSHESDVRRRAAAALLALGAVEAIPALRRAAAAEPDVETRLHLELACDGLVAEQRAIEAEQASEARQLVAQLKSSDPAIIIKAAHALGRLQDKTAVEALVLIFHNTQLPARVRLTAAEALIELRSAPAVVTLLAALKSASWKNRRKAAAVLGQLRADWAVERLAERLRDDNEHVRRTAFAALQRIGTPPAKKALEAFVHERARPGTSPLPVTQPASAAASSSQDETRPHRPDPPAATTPAADEPG
jgi:HEAT repeat protein